MLGYAEQCWAPMTKHPRWRPPLKWAGGKYRILDRIRRHLPRGSRLVEPFVGSAVVALNTEYDSYWLNDINADLINFFKVVQAHGEEFIEYACTLFGSSCNRPEVYYRLRGEFNETDDPVRKAALLLYLNKHGYNGLIRYNASGGLNVPFGRYKSPYFPRSELRRLHELGQRAVFSCLRFDDVFEGLQDGDIVYCDPPYVPLSRTADFTAYAAGGFSIDDQRRLGRLSEQAARRGIRVVVSNHYTEETRRIYHKARKYRFPVRRLISCNGERRAEVEEVLAVYTEREIARRDRNDGSDARCAGE